MRKILLSGEINSSTIKEVINNILEINDYDNKEERLKEGYKREPIYLYIDSYGGSVYSGLGLIDVMVASKTPIYTVCIGSCMSMGLIIFASGHKRFIGKNSTVMCHGASFGAFGKTPEVEESLEEVKRMEQVLVDILIEKTKIKRNKIDDIIERKMDWYIPAKEALRLGIADSFLNNI